MRSTAAMNGGDGTNSDDQNGTAATRGLFGWRWCGKSGNEAATAAKRFGCAAAAAVSEGNQGEHGLGGGTRNTTESLGRPKDNESGGVTMA